MADTDPLVSHAFSDSRVTEDGVYRDVLLGKIEINEGMLTENVAAQLLCASGHRLFFYSRYSKEDRNERMEIDFLITQGYRNAGMKMRVSPIEVKSTKTYRTSSLDKFKARFGSRVGASYVVHPKQLKVEDDRVYVPLYAGATVGRMYGNSECYDCGCAQDIDWPPFEWPRARQPAALQLCWCE